MQTSVNFTVHNYKLLYEPNSYIVSVKQEARPWTPIFSTFTKFYNVTTSFSFVFEKERKDTNRDEKRQRHRL